MMGSILSYRCSRIASHVGSRKYAKYRQKMRNWIKLSN